MFLCQRYKILEKYFAIVHGKYATISDFADLPRREQFDIASIGIEIVAERDAIMQVKSCLLKWYFIFLCRNTKCHFNNYDKQSSTKANPSRQPSGN